MFRIVPNMPAENYTTYRILAPVSTHFRPATCQEVDCPHLVNGFVATVDELTELGARQAHYIRHDSGRRFVESRTEAGLTRFEFEPGQRCFNSGEHRVRLDRPEHWLVQGGDWRGNPRGVSTRRHVSADDWRDDMSEHLDALKTAQERS